MTRKRSIAVIEQFDHDSAQYLERHVRAETVRERQRLLDLVHTGSRFRRALDLGCGPGTMSQDLLAHSEEVWGIDISEGMVRIASQRAQDANVSDRLHFRVGCAESLPFPDGHFDVVFCVGVLRYLDSLEKGLAEISRVLKPGGTFVVTFFYPYSPQWAYMCLVSRPLLPLVSLFRGRTVRESLNTHRAEPLPFSYRRFMRLARLTGFTDLRCQHSGFDLYPLRRLFPNLSRYLYLRMESRWFNSRIFGWIGSICLVSGSKRSLDAASCASRPTPVLPRSL